MKRAKTAENSYEPHLAVRGCSLPPGGEWLPKSGGWLMALVESGSGYWLRGQTSTELSTGAVLRMVGEVQGWIRASQLSGMNLLFFNVMPARLIGLMTLDEQDFLKRSALKSQPVFQVLRPDHAIATKLRDLCASRNQRGILFRLKLLQLFIETFGREFEQAMVIPPTVDSTERLRTFLRETPSDALLEININQLARMMHCTPRHVSRIFCNVTGVSFRETRAEIRLTRARELLATSSSKVVEVALESGYKSLSLFNLMFRRHFGTSPGRWRQKYGINGANKNHRNSKTHRFAIC